MTAAGLLAGLAGAVEILGVQNNLPATYATSIGFDAITVALLGRANPWGILFGGLLLGALRAGAPLMQDRGRRSHPDDRHPPGCRSSSSSRPTSSSAGSSASMVAQGGDVDELKTVTSSYAGGGGGE